MAALDGRSAIGRAIKQLQTELSTNTTGTGTIEASNTQEVANGQSAVQEPAAGAGEGKAFGLQGKGQEDNFTERQSRSSSGTRSIETPFGDRKRLVELESAELSDVEQTSPPTEHEKEWVFSNLADDAVVIRNPGKGTIANIVWRVAKALHLKDFYIVKSPSGKAFTDGSSGYRSIDYDAVISSITGDAIEDVDSILHEGLHEKLTSLRDRINRICYKHGLPLVGCHGLRRSFASLGYHLKWSERSVMAIGGWSNIQTVHNLYIKLSQYDLNDDVKAMQDYYTFTR